MSPRLLALNLKRVALLPLSALLLPIARLWPRRADLWLFAYAQGYRDNPRYLFEHVVEHGPAGVSPLWLAQSVAEAQAVTALGHPALAKRSLRGILANLRAGVVVLGSGLGEINRPLVGRARIVQLWHGAPFKRIHADFPDGDNVLPGRSPVARAVNAAVRWTANRTRSQVAMVPSQSAVVAERFQSAFGIDAGRTPVLGTPRADIIGATGPAPDAEAAALRSALLGERADVARLVLYAPTWRDGGDESFLAAGLDGTALDAVLARHDAAMVIRTHPQGERGQFDAAAAGASRVLVDHGTAPVDVNVLLRAVDLLLTDYSAISVDYALLRRPIVYFMPDLADYERSRGLYEPPSAMTGGRHCRSWDEVIAALDACFTDPEPYLAPVDEVRARYWGHLDTRSCERIARAIATGAPAAGILA